MICLESFSNAQPDWKMESDLSPGKDPGYGSEVINAACGLALGGPATNVDAAQLRDGCGLLEVVNEAGVLAHHSSVCIT